MIGFKRKSPILFFINYVYDGFTNENIKGENIKEITLQLRTNFELFHYFSYIKKKKRYS